MHTLTEMFTIADDPLGVDWPGCDTPLTWSNAGGYRTYCQKCVDAMPDIPGGVDDNGYAKGYHLEGRYPNFRWVVDTH